MESANLPTEVKIIVESLDELDEEIIDNLTNSLMEDLREFDVYSILKHNEEPDNNTKGDSVTIGVLLLAVMPTILPSILEFIKTWAVDNRRVTLEAPNGAKIEFVPDKKYSKKELMKFLEELNDLS